ncbi:hypothetical protein [Limoniibacter endophyticus]|nr:hypothetical protein [Limoniibacter endophyticus]
MKITEVETIQLPYLNNIPWVRARTHDRIVGLGEAFCGANAVAAYIHSDLAPRRVGLDPLEPGIPVCASETLATRSQFLDVLKTDATDYVMLEISWCGDHPDAVRPSTRAT